QVHDFPANRESQAEAAVLIAAVFGGKKWSEHSFEILLLDSFAGVDHPDANPVTVGLRLDELYELDTDHGLQGRSIDGVGNDVGNHPLDEHLVHFHQHFSRHVLYDIDLSCRASRIGDIDGLCDLHVQTAQLKIGP